MKSRMMKSLSLPLWCYALPAFLVSVPLLLAQLVTMPVWFGEALSLPFAMIVIFYWAVFYPRFLPGFLVFCFGLAVDFLYLGPVGLHALCFYGVWRASLWQRSFLMEQSFFVLWGVFGSFYLAFLTFVYGISLIFYGMGMDLYSLALRFLLGSLSFAPIYAALHGTFRFYMTAVQAAEG